MQQGEAIDIRRKSDAFGERVEEFRRFFQTKAPFTVAGAELKLQHVSFSCSFAFAVGIETFVQHCWVSAVMSCALVFLRNLQTFEIKCTGSLKLQWYDCVTASFLEHVCLACVAKSKAWLRISST